VADASTPLKLSWNNNLPPHAAKNSDATTPNAAEANNNTNSHVIHLAIKKKGRKLKPN
jgi:hypothetical protein